MLVLACPRPPAASRAHFHVHVADVPRLHSSAPPIDAAIRLGHYVPYHQLTKLTHLAVTPKENDSVLASLTASQNLDRAGELDIAVAEWMTAGDAVAKLVCTYHGNARAVALEAHHHTVIGLAVKADWTAAFAYDVAEREMAAAQPVHDLGTPNQAHMNLATTEYFARKEQKANLDAMRQLIQNANLRRPLPAGPPVADQPLCKRPHVLQGNIGGPQGDGGGARNHARGGRCFRCGVAGHMPAACNAATTTTGRPTAALSNDARSAHTLISPDGRTFCFAFALHSVCQHDAGCQYYHGCSICGATTHGAGGCGRN